MTESLLAEPDSEITDLWHDYRPTRLLELPALAHRANVARVFVKVEGERPLGNFKVLGGMFAGLRALARAVGGTTIRDLCAQPGKPLPRLICASDGNHGLAVAAAARRANAPASVYLPANISRVRAERIEALGAEIVPISGTYDDAVNEAATAAARGEGLLIPDTTSDPNDPVVRDVMAGYALLTRELISQLREVGDSPSHLFIQAGVGGLAAAMAQGLWRALRAPKKLVTVEPEAAACVAHALEEERPVRISGNLYTAAEMLSCGVASAPALEILLRYRVRAVVVTEEELHGAVVEMLDASGPATTPSGAAGFAGLLHVAACDELREIHQLDSDSSVLLVATEGSVVGDHA